MCAPEEDPNIVFAGLIWFVEHLSSDSGIIYWSTKRKAHRTPCAEAQALVQFLPEKTILGMHVKSKTSTKPLRHAGFQRQRQGRNGGREGGREVGQHIARNNVLCYAQT